MKILFFDMEFANGRVPGSIYSIGYLVTNENFKILKKPTDLLINPDATWNTYVERNILAYPKAQVEAAPKFPAHYKKIKRLFAQVNLAVGFAVNNDVGALRQDCARYGLEFFPFRHFDTEKLCKLMDENRQARGLEGCVRAWCGETPENRHRSDGDAYATMLLMRGICRAKHVTPEMLVQAYPECLAVSMPEPRRLSLWERFFSRKTK